MKFFTIDINVQSFSFILFELLYILAYVHFCTTTKNKSFNVYIYIPLLVKSFNLLNKSV